MSLKVLSAGAVKVGVTQLVAEYGRETGTQTFVEFDTAPRVRERILSGERPHVVVAPPAALDALDAAKLLRSSRASIGRARMGVVVHADAAVESRLDLEALIRLLTNASTVVHNRASSGAYAGTLFERLGLSEVLRNRIKIVDTGAGVIESVAGDRAAVGIAQISEIRRVLNAQQLPARLAGALPDAVQKFTAYEAVALSEDSRAAELPLFLASDRAKAVFAESGID